MKYMTALENHVHKRDTIKVTMRHFYQNSTQIIWSLIISYNTKMKILSDSLLLKESNICKNKIWSFNTVQFGFKKTALINFREAGLLSSLFILLEDLELKIVFIIIFYSLLTTFSLLCDTFVLQVIQQNCFENLYIPVWASASFDRRG